jgi:galactokinase
MATSILETNSALSRTHEIADRFQQVYGTSPRAIFRAPGRVNLIGEHTDYNDGFVMPTAINLYAYSAIAGRADQTLSVYSEQFGETVELDLAHLEGPPRKHWSDYVRGVAAALQNEGYPLKGANLFIDGRVPIGSGLSSSAAIEVATALALTTLGGITIPLLQVARLCQHAENEYTGARCGIMDQFISCFGKANHALMLDCRSLSSTPVPLPPDATIVICNTNVKHELAAGEYNDRRRSCERSIETLHKVLPNARALRDITMQDLERYRGLLSEVDYRRCRHVITENARVTEAADALKRGDLSRFGELMYQSHESLDRDYEVTSTELNLMVELARGLNGVYGARMTGGGFGGCTVNLVDTQEVPEFQAQILSQYQVKTGRVADIYVCSAADGARALSVN